MDTASNSSLIVDQLVTYADWFFPGEIDFDRDLDQLGGSIINGSETSTPPSSGGLRRCVSQSSLSDHESPTQGSPKPATRRKNKPAPTPPSGNTPDKRPDDKPPPAPDKPPRPLVTPTLSRASSKGLKQENIDFIGDSNPPTPIKTESNCSKNLENNFTPLNFDAINKTDHFKVIGL